MIDFNAYDAYTKIREQNKEKAAERRARIYAEIPELTSLDDVIKSVNLTIREGFLEQTLDNEQMRQMIDKATREVMDKRAALLSQHGYTESDLGEIYSCESCKDTGKINSRWCRCKDILFVKYLQNELGISYNASHTFDKFDLELYSDKDFVEGISHRAHMQNALREAFAFVKGQSKIKHMIFYGKPGLGKTFLSDCIANYMSANGVVVYYMSAPRLLSMYEDVKFGRDTSSLTAKKIQLVQDCEVLVLDDLGTEFRTTYTDSALFDIVNSRLITEKSIIISTNIELKDLYGRYSERFISRIMGYFEPIHFYGDDIRIKQGGY